MRGSIQGAKLERCASAVLTAHIMLDDEGSGTTLLSFLSRRTSHNVFELLQQCHDLGFQRLDLGFGADTRMYDRLPKFRVRFHLAAKNQLAARRN